MADSGAVEIPQQGGIERPLLMSGAFIAASRQEGNPQRIGGNLPEAHVRTCKMKGHEKARVYKDLNENLVNRKILLECSKNAKKADDKAQCLS
ncbi:hypothetical protein J3P71_09905 [Rhizobium leguminosarum]|uniref:hypothetical protein n=1 Tax=Rhizobium leguminosarum TaxID=384 RepID=UPI001441ADD3|nr:hypothetical protein [Rhizobium leguminosarum]MBY5837192.1 hypothetical protein [Rhizobium leguminosarum]QSZ10960.1 hypothetical protein J3P71_09905 [Rhizobium leguminosarum]